MTCQIMFLWISHRSRQCARFGKGMSVVPSRQWLSTKFISACSAQVLASHDQVSHTWAWLASSGWSIVVLRAESWRPVGTGKGHHWLARAFLQPQMSRSCSVEGACHCHTAWRAPDRALGRTSDLRRLAGAWRQSRRGSRSGVPLWSVAWTARQWLVRNHCINLSSFPCGLHWQDRAVLG